jgi:hypothetical protein
MRAYIHTNTSQARSLSFINSEVGVTTVCSSFGSLAPRPAPRSTASAFPPAASDAAHSWTSMDGRGFSAAGLGLMAFLLLSLVAFLLLRRWYKRRRRRAALHQEASRLPTRLEPEEGPCTVPSACHSISVALESRPDSPILAAVPTAPATLASPLRGDNSKPRLRGRNNSATAVDEARAAAQLQAVVRGRQARAWAQGVLIAQDDGKLGRARSHGLLRGASALREKHLATQEPLMMREHPGRRRETHLAAIKVQAAMRGRQVRKLPRPVSIPAPSFSHYQQARGRVHGGVAHGGPAAAAGAAPTSAAASTPPPSSAGLHARHHAGGFLTA